MRNSAFAALTISTYMLVYGAFQLFVIDPEGQFSIYHYAIFSTIPVIVSLVFTLLVILFAWAYIQSEGRIFSLQARKEEKRGPQHKISFQPPGKKAFEIFMLVSLIFSALGTFKHDVVLYAAGVFIFLLPVFLDPYIGRSEKRQQSEESKRVMNWEMLAAIIALIALVWELLIHYGLIP